MFSGIWGGEGIGVLVLGKSKHTRDFGFWGGGFFASFFRVLDGDGVISEVRGFGMWFRGALK